MTICTDTPIEFLAATVLQLSKTLLLDCVPSSSDLLILPLLDLFDVLDRLAPGIWLTASLQKITRQMKGDKTFQQLIFSLPLSKMKLNRVDCSSRFAIPTIHLRTAPESL